MEKYKCLLIGAGSIGALKPDNVDFLGETAPLTHTHAIINNPEIKLIGIVERNIDTGMRCYDKWGIEVFQSIDHFLQSPDKCDIVTIATPTETHNKVIMEVVDKIKPKLIICEKPFCLTLGESYYAKTLCDHNNIKLIINYSREFTTLNNFVEKLKENKYGNIISCTLHYTRGLVRDGCHAIHMFNKMFGKLENALILDYDDTVPIDDYSTADLTVPVYLQYEKCKTVVMVPHDGRNYSIFDIVILTTDYRISFMQHGKYVIIEPAQQEEVYGNFKSMNYRTKKEMHGINLYNSMICLYETACDELSSNEDCDYADRAIAVHEVYERMEHMKTLKGIK